MAYPHTHTHSGQGTKLIVGTVDFTITDTHILWHSGNEDHLKLLTKFSEIDSGTEIKHKASKI
jgi:hypothetical protein